MKKNKSLELKPSQLGDYFRIKHGFAFKGEFFTDSGKYILLTPGNFQPEGGLKLKGDKEKYYSAEFPPEFLLKSGDLLLAMTDLIQNAPILGSPALITETNRYLHNQRLGKIIDLDTSKLDKNFLYHLMNFSEVREQIKGSATGSTVRHTAPDRIYKVRVRIPPLPTQRRIADILSAYDDLIENNTRRIRILEGMAQAIYQEWFGKVGKESMPEGWEITTLGEACNIVMGQSPASEFYNENGKGLPFHQGVTNFGDRFPTDKVFCTVENRIAEKGDVLFSVRAPVGRLNISTKKIVIGRGLCAIRSKTGNQSFVFQQLKEQFHEDDMMGGGTIFKSVTKDDVHGIKFLLPSKDIIEKFETFANPISRELEILTVKNANLRQTRDLLLPRLVSGEIAV